MTIFNGFSVFSWTLITISWELTHWELKKESTFLKIVEGVPEMRWTWAQVETYILNGVDWIYRTRLKNRMIICLLSPTIAEKDGRSKFTWLFSSLIVCLTTKTTMTDSSVECVDSRVQRTSFFFLLFFCSAVTFFSLFFFCSGWFDSWQLTGGCGQEGKKKEKKEKQTLGEFSSFLRAESKQEMAEL